ncbi:hypothetical protein HU200_015628 [Digitaria exilis]|uniref:Uncharacterized protein n=1 Tax=Digitaria exilis TaxID=1010633 RepID=A0A835KIP9_9POAL|nr:hypothetical protein HU200_015628 [Digitaria exilis]
MDWWTQIATTTETPHKATRTLALLVSWEVWKERNSRIFQHVEAPTMSVLDKIRGEALLWVFAGAKDLAQLLGRE